MSPRRSLTTSAVIGALILVVAGAFSQRASATTYNYTTIDVPGSVATIPAAINDSGAVTGYYDASPSNYAFLYSGGTYTSLNPPGSGYSQGTGINDSGTVIGDYPDPQGGVRTGFVYSGGAYSPPIGTGYEPGLTAINAAGTVAGIGIQDIIHGTVQSFLYSGVTYTGIDVSGSYTTAADAINASGEVAGYHFNSQNGEHFGFVASIPNGSDAYVYTTINVPGSSETEVYGVNDSGALSGDYVNGSNFGFLYSGGIYTSINFPGSNAGSTTVTGINNSDEVFGSYGKGNSTLGFVYSDGTYISIQYPDSIDTMVNGINNSAQLTGSYLNSSSTDGFIATPVSGCILCNPCVRPGACRVVLPPVPEPAIWEMMLVGFSCLGFGAYRRTGRKDATSLAAAG